jgi:hypothetical protein
MIPAFNRWRVACSGFSSLRPPPPPHARLVAHDAAEPVVGLQRIAAGGDEVEHAAPHHLIQPRIGERGAHLGQQVPFLERRGAGAGHHVLGENIQRTGAEVLAITLPFIYRILGGERFEEFEPVAWHQQRLAGAIEPVVGASHALQQAAGALGRTHLHHQVDIAPVHAKVEAGRGHQGAQLPARHSPFHLAAAFRRERTVVHADGQVVLVHIPQLLEHVFGQKAGVGEHQRGLVGLDPLVQLRDRPAGCMAAPGYTRIPGFEDLDLRIGPPLALHQRHGIDLAKRGQPAAESFGIGQGGRQGYALHLRRNGLQAGHRQGQQVAALLGGEGVNLVHHHPLEAAEQVETVRETEQQAEAFRRGQQHAGWADALALLAIGRRITTARLHRDWQAHRLDRGDQVPLHVMRQRLQRRDVERVQPFRQRRALQH